MSKSPDELGDELLEAGVTLFTVSTDGPDYDIGDLEAWVAWRDRRNG